MVYKTHNIYIYKYYKGVIKSESIFCNNRYQLLPRIAHNVYLNHETVDHSTGHVPRLHPTNNIKELQAFSKSAMIKYYTLRKIKSIKKSRFIYYLIQYYEK